MGVELTILNSFHSQRGRGSKDHFLGRGEADRWSETWTWDAGRESDLMR